MAERDEEHIDRVLGGRTSLEERRALGARMTNDAALARHYDVRVLAERALGGDDVAVPSAAELDALLPAILDEVAPRRRRRWLALAGLPAFAAAAAAVLVVVLGPQDDFRARGGVAPAVRSEAFCVDAGVVRAADRCPRGASLVVRVDRALAGQRATVRFRDARGVSHGGDVSAVVDDDGLVPAPVALHDGVAAGGGRLEARSSTGASFSHEVIVVER